MDVTNKLPFVHFQLRPLNEKARLVLAARFGCQPNSCLDTAARVKSHRGERASSRWQVRAALDQLARGIDLLVNVSWHRSEAFVRCGIPLLVVIS